MMVITLLGNVRFSTNEMYDVRANDAYRYDVVCFGI